MKLVRGRLAAVSVRASFLAGMWVGVTLGLVAGSILGAFAAWAAGTILGWQRDLAFTLGVARALLPLGDQVAALRWMSTTWYLLIPAAAVVVEIPDEADEAMAEVAADATTRRRRVGIRRDRGGDRAGSPKTRRSAG